MPYTAALTGPAILFLGFFVTSVRASTGMPGSPIKEQITTIALVLGVLWTISLFLNFYIARVAYAKAEIVGLREQQKRASDRIEDCHRQTKDLLLALDKKKVDAAVCSVMVENFKKTLEKMEELCNRLDNPPRGG